MNTRKALKHTVAKYQWLEKNPRALESDWPEYRKYGRKDPLCQVADGDCMKCPLIALWIEGSEVLPKKQQIKACLVKTSPFMIRRNERSTWTPIGLEAVKKACRAIYEEAERALREGIRKPDLSVFRTRRSRRERPERSRRERVSRREKNSGRVRRNR